MLADKLPPMRDCNTYQEHLEEALKWKKLQESHDSTPQVYKSNPELQKLWAQCRNNRNFHYNEALRLIAEERDA